MLSRKAKAAFYSFIGPLMYLNGKIQKNIRNYKGTVKVQLGPGQSNYINGWINVDANMFTAKCDIWADLRNELPFKNESVDVFYSHHVIEHLPDLQYHFKELYRCLKKGGVIRVGVPNSDSAVRKYIQGDKAWFFDFPDNRNSIGGRLDNYIYCRQEHLSMLTPSYLEELASNAGFKNIKVCLPTKETNYPNLIDNLIFEKEWETDFEFTHTLIIEAIKE